MSDRGLRRALFFANMVIVAVSVMVAQGLWSVLAGRNPAPVLPTALKVITAALWVVAAIRFRSALTSCRYWRPTDRAASASASDPTALKARPPTPRPPETQARGREQAFFQDQWLIEKADARREPRDTRDDLEARPCRT